MHRRRDVAARRRPGAVVECLEGRTLLSTTFFVATKGSDANSGTDPAHAWQHIQHAFDVATPGSTVNVLAGRYNEKLTLNVSGNATDGFITFQALGKVTISGRGVAGSDIIFINNRNYVRIVGFNIADDLRVNNGAGIRLTSADDNIQILDNRIENITGLRAMGITAYGTDPVAGISNLVISGNEVFHCQSAPSEALTLNGNVHDFSVTHNYVHDVNSIGIDLIGGEGMSADPATDLARNGEVSDNRVTRAKPIRGADRDAAGIFVDGAQNAVIERNICWADQVGIEVGAVHPVAVAMDDSIRDNIVYSNKLVGVSIGGSDASQGRVRNCVISNNTIYHDGASRSGGGEIRAQWGSNNVFENNLIVAAAGGALINFEYGETADTSDYNLLFTPRGVAASPFEWASQPVIGVAGWQEDSQQDYHSLFASPRFNRRAGILRLDPASPGVNAGDPAFTPAAGETDINGQPRVLGGRVDVGADEVA